MWVLPIPRGRPRGAAQGATAQTCWDAERLDLGRVGKTPRVEKLCTEEARDSVLRDLAYRRSLKG